MKITKYLRRIFLAVGLVMPMLLPAVTQKEMEEARTIAAKAYIRWANDGSGYLDEYNPKTMAELEAVLKPKEVENLKAFKAIPVPTDYQSWDKDKLVEFWVGTFQNPGLQEKGRGGRIRARSLINKMKVTPPGADNTSSQAAPATAATPAPQSASPIDTVNNDGALNEIKADEKAILDLEGDEEELEVDNADSYTWVYIMVLAILVAIVVALVVYAANVFKKNGNEKQYASQDHHVDKERYETMISDKDDEVSVLTKKLEISNRQNSEMKAKLEAALAEIAALKVASKGKMNVETANSGAKMEGGSPQRTSRSPENQERPRGASNEGSSEKPRGTLRSIYLGRANAKGMFVRADRTLNPGNSVFLLDTTDGRSGLFRVADSPAAWDLALSNPAEYLENACAGPNLEDTEDVSKILTESPGTALFEDGCWRVIRKARIRYE